MASEITLTGGIRVDLTGRSRSMLPTAKRFNQSGSVVYHNDHAIGTTEENITSLGDITLPALVMLRNADATNYVEAGFATAVYPIALPPGMWSTIVLKSGQSLFLKANTAACVVEVFAVGTTLSQT